MPNGGLCGQLAGLPRKAGPARSPRSQMCAHVNTCRDLPPWVRVPVFALRCECTELEAGGVHEHDYFVLVRLG